MFQNMYRWSPLAERNLSSDAAIFPDHVSPKSDA
jgi:hypothetical protein